ncbi:MAG: hypothetical protein ACM3MG_07585 [Bacillota bacterium]
MKRIGAVLVVIGFGLGLFWWGRSSHTASSVMSTSEEPSASSEQSVVSAGSVEPVKKTTTESSAPKNPQRAAATTGSEDRMKSRQVSRDKETSVLGPNGNPNPERLLKTNLVTDTKWKVWSGVKAIPSRSFQGDKSEVLAVMGGYSVVADESMNGDDRNFSASKPMVLYDERMSRPGIVTGELKVSLAEGVDPEVIANEYRLAVTSGMKNIRLFFMRSKDQIYDLGGLLSSLKNDARISKVELSVVSRSYEKF